jgi:predicted transcriptional regulator
MSKKRTKPEIIYNILEVCIGNGIMKTTIVYKANLNFSTVKPYLDMLIKRDFLEVVQGKNTLYKTTAKGADALESLKNIEEICS